MSRDLGNPEHLLVRACGRAGVFMFLDGGVHWWCV